MSFNKIAVIAVFLISASLCLAVPSMSADDVMLPSDINAAIRAAEDANKAPASDQQPQPVVDTPNNIADPDYKIAEEDVLRIDVWGEPQLSNMQVQVTDDGKINIAFIGEVKAVGLTQAELTKEIVRRLEEDQIIYNPKIQLTITTLHRPTMRVLGEVNRPGEVQFKDGDTIMDAIAQAGSYREEAMLEKAVLIRRSSGENIKLDLRKMFDDGDMTQNFKLEKGDTIFIPAEDYNNKVYVLGHVLKPGLYPIKKKTTLLSAISLAGGPNEKGSMKGTAVIRMNNGKPERLPCDVTKLLDKADMSQDIALRPGDVVIVPASKKLDLGFMGQILNIVSSLSQISHYGLF